MSCKKISIEFFVTSFEDLEKWKNQLCHCRNDSVNFSQEKRRRRFAEEKYKVVFVGRAFMPTTHVFCY